MINGEQRFFYSLDYSIPGPCLWPAWVQEGVSEIVFGFFKKVGLR